MCARQKDCWLGGGGGDRQQKDSWLQGDRQQNSSEEARERRYSTFPLRHTVPFLCHAFRKKHSGPEVLRRSLGHEDHSSWRLPSSCLITQSTAGLCLTHCEVLKPVPAFVSVQRGFVSVHGKGFVHEVLVRTKRVSVMCPTSSPSRRCYQPGNNHSNGIPRKFYLDTKPCCIIC